MANTVTSLYSVGYKINGCGPQFLKEVQIDTVNTDLELASPIDERYQQLSAVFFSDNSAAIVKFKSRSQALTGTVSTTNGDATVTGTGTKFLTELAEGQEIVVTDGNTLTVLSIADDESLEATATASSSVSGKTFKRQKFINRSVELAANQGLAKGFGQELLPIVADKGESLVMQSDTAITSLTLGLMFPGKANIGTKT